jgi:hypothetical protein
MPRIPNHHIEFNNGCSEIGEGAISTGRVTSRSKIHQPVEGGREGYLAQLSSMAAEETHKSTRATSLVRNGAGRERERHTQSHRGCCSWGTGRVQMDREKFGIMKHDGCGFDEIEAQARVSPLWKSWA